MRLLRVLWRAGGRVHHIESELQVSDQRTLDGIFKRAGFSTGQQQRMLGRDEFLSGQHFISPTHPSMCALTALLEDAKRFSKSTAG